MPYYYVDDDLGKAWGINNNLDWFIIDDLCELVDNDKYWVIAIFFSIYQNW